jgi:transcriptional regulator with XRE-family HTH domain
MARSFDAEEFSVRPAQGTAPGSRMSRDPAVDRHVGARISERRILLGLTQQQLADLIGITYQQAGKYEHGISRVPPSRLCQIAAALDVPVSYFFSGIEPGGEHTAPVAADDLEHGRLDTVSAGRPDGDQIRRHQWSADFAARLLEAFQKAVEAELQDHRALGRSPSVTRSHRR